MTIEIIRSLVRPLIAFGSFLLLAITGVMQIPLPETVIRICEMAIGWYFMSRASDKAQQLIADKLAPLGNPPVDTSTNIPTA